jgi:hypothetical protein
MSKTKSELVTVEFLGIPLQVKFKKMRHDYMAHINESDAYKCYERALDKLNRPDYDKGYRLEVSSGRTSLGLFRSVTLYRYVQDADKDSVQYVMSLRLSEVSQTYELSVSFTVYSFYVELPESDNLYLFGD